MEAITRVFVTCGSAAQLGITSGLIADDLLLPSMSRGHRVLGISVSCLRTATHSRTWSSTEFSLPRKRATGLTLRLCLLPGVVSSLVCSEWLYSLMVPAPIMMVSGCGGPVLAASAPSAAKEWRCKRSRLVGFFSYAYAPFALEKLYWNEKTKQVICRSKIEFLTLPSPAPHPARGCQQLPFRPGSSKFLSITTYPDPQSSITQSGMGWGELVIRPPMH